MNKKTIGMALVVVGLIVAVVSLAADWIGIGTYPGINITQAAGIILGVVAAAGGFWLQRSASKE